MYWINMHTKAIKRIKEAKKKTDKRPELVSKLPKKDYANFKNAIGRLCDDMLKTKIKQEEKQKVAWIRSRIEIEM